MKNLTTLLCALSLAASMTVTTPKPARACVSDCDSGLAVSILLLGLLAVLVATSPSGGIVSTKNEPAKPAKGKLLQKF